MVKFTVEKPSNFSKQLLMNRTARSLKNKKVVFKRTGFGSKTQHSDKQILDVDVDKMKTFMSLGHLDTIQELQPDDNMQLNKLFVSKIKDWGFHKQNKNRLEQNKINSVLTIKQNKINQKNEIDGFKFVNDENNTFNNIPINNIEKLNQDSQDGSNLMTDERPSQIVNFNNSQSQIDISSEKTSNVNLFVEDQGLTMLGCVRSVLKDLFLLKFSSQHDRYLNYAEFAVLGTVLEKKFNTQLAIKNIYSLNDFKYLGSIQSSKRPEESYKFVFKYAFKNLKECFCKINNIEISTIKKPEVFKQFYHYYFGEISKRCNIDIESFYLPLTPDTYGLDLNTVAAKTINSTYVRLIIKSKSFLTDFMEFVNEKFRNEYINLVPKKIDSMIDKLEHSFENAWYNDRYIDVICDNIKSNKRCKLPWTIKELDYAIRQTNRLISKNLSKNNK